MSARAPVSIGIVAILALHALGCASDTAPEAREPSASSVSQPITISSEIEPDNVVVLPSGGSHAHSSLAFDGTNWLAAYVCEDFRVCGARVSGAGKVLDAPAFAISPTYTTSLGYPAKTAVAFDGTNYLVVWSSYLTSTSAHSLFGARVSTSGVPLDKTPIAISDSTADQTDAHVGFDGSNFLVTWSQDGNVYGRRVSSAGIPSGSSFAIDTSGYANGNGLVCGPSSCLVVWGLLDYAIQGARVSKTSVVDTTAITIGLATDWGVTAPSVAWDGTQYFVVWIDTSSSLKGSLKAAHVSTGGAVTESTPLSLGDAAYDGPTAITFDGTNHLVAALKVAGCCGSIIQAKRVSPSGTVLDSTPFTWSVTGYDADPAVAASSSRFLVSFTGGSTGDIWGARLDSGGTVLETKPFPVSAIAVTERSPAVASDGTGYLTVFASETNILGARVNATGTPLDPAGINIGSGSSSATPRAAFDGTNYRVVHDGVLGVRLSAPGTKLGTSIISSSPGYPYVHRDTPDIACMGTKCLVVWADDRKTDPIDESKWGFYYLSIYGAIVDGTDTVLKESAIAAPGTGTATFNRTHPSVVFDGTDFMVVWKDGRTATGIYAARVTTGGTVLDPDGIAVALGAVDAPSIAFDGTNLMVVWSDTTLDGGDIYGRRLTTDGKPLDTAPFVIAKASGAQVAPRVVYTDDKHAFFVAWADKRGATSDVYGAWVSTAGVVLDPSGVVIAGDTTLDETKPSIGVLGGGKMLVAYERALSTTSTATHVEARLVSSGSLDGAACTAGTECASRACIESFCCDTKCDGVCSTCSLTGKEGTCSAVVSVDDPDTCTGDTTCDAKGACLKKNGKACTASTECASTFCIDGFCCASACDGGCGVCDATPGTCTAAKVGSKGAHPTCAGYLCDGKALACPTTCASDADCSSDHYCSSANLCEASKSTSASCNATTDCASPPCRECASTFCADGYCCDKACDGACDECAAEPGTCHLMKKGTEGAPSCAPYACTGASSACDTECVTKDDCAPGGWCEGGECFANREIGKDCGKDEACKSGHCADGVCCEGKCAGQCEACDVDGSKGKCTAVVGKPHTPRDACGGGSPDAPCSQLGCDGVVRTTCAGYAGKDTICAKAKCEAGAESPEGRCNGKGACGASSTPCDPYVCGPTACKTSCTIDADCAKGLLCDGGRCKSTSRCDGAHTLTNLDGSTTDCAPYACTEDGICRKSCHSTSDCADGFQCDEHGACVPAPPPDQGSGCGCRVGGGEQDASPVALAMLVLSVCVRRRRRQEVVR